VERFGTGQITMGKLDEALPLEQEKKRGAEASAMDDPGFSNKRRGCHGGRRGRKDKNRGDRPTRVTKLPPAYVSEEDRLAAEAWKKKFATGEKFGLATFESRLRNSKEVLQSNGCMVKSIESNDTCSGMLAFQPPTR